MYIISLTYKVSLEKIDEHLISHVAYLNEQYEEGIFLMSGKKVPRSGGLILAQAENKEAMMEILSQDPFYKNQLADYDVIGFIPSMACPELQFLMN